MAATTQKLNYASAPPRATSSRALRNEVIPSNGTSFTLNNTVIFDLPSNLNNTFWDVQSSYISLDLINNKNVAADSCHFEGGGFPACIKRIAIEIGGQTLMSCDNWNALYQAMFDLDTAAQFRDNAGKVLFGSANAVKGQALAANTVANGGGTKIKVCFPLVLTPLMNSKYWPLMSRERVRIRLELDTAVRSLIGGTAVVADSDIVIDNVKLVQYNLELGSDVMAQVAASSGGTFKIACPNYQSHQATLAAGASSLSATLGFSMSSLNRIIVCQQLQAAVFTASVIGNRSQADLDRFSVSIGGVKYPQIDLKDDGGGAEILAEALVSQNSLTSWGHQSSIDLGGNTFAANEPTGALGADAATGHYLIDLNLESQRIAGGEAGMGLVSGLNTVGQTVQAQFDYSNGVTAAHIVNIFAEHTILCMLDLNSLTWSIAV
tara:strand:- start:973 stop:2277 length:1305 start_codon:yes stop_codon:yes gene_type:complete